MQRSRAERSIVPNARATCFDVNPPKMLPGIAPPPPIPKAHFASLVVNTHLPRAHTCAVASTPKIPMNMYKGGNSHSNLGKRARYQDTPKTTAYVTKLVVTSRRRLNFCPRRTYPATTNPTSSAIAMSANDSLIALHCSRNNASRATLPMTYAAMMRLPAQIVSASSWSHSLAPLRKNNMGAGFAPRFRHAWRVPFCTTTSPRLR